MKSAPASSSVAAASSDDWGSISNELLQGLIHALNNRVAALSAFVELARLDDEGDDSLGELPTELAQLHRVSGLFALLPERRTEAEALELSTVLDDAIQLHAHHPRLRAERCDVRYEGTPMPVRAPRWLLLRTLVMLVHAAKRAGETAQGRGGATIVVHSDEASVSVSVHGVAKVPADLAALAERAGGELAHEDDTVLVRLPSLAELRRREREARGERG
jgi:C4-dicarboxylate-specific signal transduction histidine kinase